MSKATTKIKAKKPDKQPEKKLDDFVVVAELGRHGRKGTQLYHVDETTTYKELMDNVQQAHYDYRRERISRRGKTPSFLNEGISFAEGLSYSIQIENIDVRALKRTSLVYKENALIPDCIKTTCPHEGPVCFLTVMELTNEWKTSNFKGLKEHGYKKKTLEIERPSKMKKQMPKMRSDSSESGFFSSVTSSPGSKLAQNLSFNDMKASSKNFQDVETASEKQRRLSREANLLLGLKPQPLDLLQIDIEENSLSNPFIKFCEQVESPRHVPKEDYNSLLSAIMEASIREPNFIKTVYNNLKSNKETNVICLLNFGVFSHMSLSNQMGKKFEESSSNLTQMDNKLNQMGKNFEEFSSNLTQMDNKLNAIQEAVGARLNLALDLLEKKDPKNI